eukprot:4176891-Alexandrium_andersonii.AAC.1
MPREVPRARPVCRNGLRAASSSSRPASSRSQTWSFSWFVGKPLTASNCAHAPKARSRAGRPRT